jgi:tetratricopeptide (TPR) repeat protein
MIVRNEEANLEACLQSARGLVDETIVVDTDSTDRTKEIAGRLGARVYNFEWVDSFAAARNESLRHATGDWIFWLDADDRLDETSRGKLRSLFAELKDETAGYLMKHQSLTGSSSGVILVADQVRLFPNHPDIRWQYRVHEQIAPAVARLGGELRPTDIVIRHTGYSEEVVKARKLDRNLRLLELDNIEHPDDPSVMFHLAWTYQAKNRPADAVPLVRRALQVSDPVSRTTGSIYAVLVVCLRQLRQDDEALATCRQGLARYPDDPDLLFHGAALLWKTGDVRGSEDCLLRLLAVLPEMRCTVSADTGLHGNTVRRNLAVIYYTQRRYADAEAHWRAILATQPEDTSAWMGLTDAFLAQGRLDALEKAAQELAAQRDRHVEAGVLQARLHLARREFAAARPLLEQVIARAPQAIYPRFFLGEALLQEGRDLGAAEKALRDLLALDPNYAPAQQRLQALLRQQGRAV